MNQNDKWNEIQSLLKQCYADLKTIENNIITLEKALEISKNH